MVYFFEPRGYQEDTGCYLIYMGKDKYENEELISYGLPTDIWFHVEDLSSAHVYLRLNSENDLDNIPSETLEDCAQLVKANSIQGNKKASVSVMYTPWSNLNKELQMVPGEVGFHKLDLIRRIEVNKISGIIKRLNKTKRERYPDLKSEKEEYEMRNLRKKKAENLKAKQREKEELEAKKREEGLRSYSNLMKKEKMKSRKELSEKYESYEAYEDDFM